MSTTHDWALLAARLREKISCELFTVLDVDWKDQLVRRSFSSDERHYPSGGVKRLLTGQWADQVIFQKRVFVSKNAAEFRAAFSDYELLEGLGLRFALNIPIVKDGRTIHTLNLLDTTGPYSASCVTQAQAAVSAYLAER